MPLEVFDFRTDVRNVFITPEMRSRIMRMEPGAVSPGHTHDLGHEVFLVLDGHAEFTIDGETAVLGPGQLCFARVNQWHEVRCVGDAPMTMYLSVTPHLEPTHTQWTHEGGEKLPYRYGASTKPERDARTTPPIPPADLLAAHLAATDALAAAAQESATTQAAIALHLRAALEHGDHAGGRAAIDAMWQAIYTMYTQLQAMEQAWNELAPAVAGEQS